MDALQSKAAAFFDRMKENANKVVQIKGGAPSINLQLRKKLDVQIPLAPDLRFTMGTDVHLADRDGGFDLAYHPNFQWGITETWFNGTFHVDTMNKEVKYTKDFDLDAVVLKVSGTYDYLHNAPYFGFKVMTTAGVSSPANSNGFSIRKKFEKTSGGVTMEAEVEATVSLGEQKYNPVEGKMSSSPTEIDLNNIRLLVLV